MYVIQSIETGQFLAPDEDGQPQWVVLLRDAGVLDDVENCSQIIDDHLEPWEQVHIVDLCQLHRLIEL